MAYYNELNEILDIVIGKYILNNQNICKLLYYYPESENLSYDPLSEKDIEDTRVMLLNYIYPMPKSPDTETKQKGFMTVVLDGGDISTINKGYRKVNLVFDIIVHLNSWIIKSAYRPYKIANEIDKIFNNKVVDLPITGLPVSFPFRIKDYSSAYYGIQLVYELTLNSNIECFQMPKNINTTENKNNIPSFKSSILGRKNGI